MRAIEAVLLQGSELYREVILDKLAHARESVLIATANLKDMQVERDGKFVSVLALFSDLAARGVDLRILHAELPSRPFRASFEKRRRTTARVPPRPRAPAPPLSYTERPYGSHRQRTPSPARRTRARLARVAHGAPRRSDGGGAGARGRPARRPASPRAPVLVPGARVRDGNGLALERNHHQRAGRAQAGPRRARA